MAKIQVVNTNRDPIKEDIYEELTLWISREYIPNRVFQGQNGKWEFIGKFYPNIKEK